MTHKPFAFLIFIFVAPVAALFACGKSEPEKATPKTTEAPAHAAHAVEQAPPTHETPAAGGYVEHDAVANAGKITGTVTYSGDKKPAPLNVTKDEKVCSHGGKPDGSIVVKDGKLKNAIVYLINVKEGKKWSSESVTLDNKECLFEPRVTIGKYKGEVATKNSDPLLHNTNLSLKTNGHKTLYNISLPKQGQVISKPLKKEGLVDAKCDVHPWMQAWIHVSEHPYAAVSATDGTFTLEQVPPGEYQVKAWHEVFGEQEMKVTVAANGTANLNVAYK